MPSATCLIEDLGSVSLGSWWLEHVGLTDWPCWNLLGFSVSIWCQRHEMKGLASICDTCCWLLIWFSGSSCSLTRVECFRHFSWHRRRSCSPRTCSSPSPMLLNYSSQFLCFEHRIPHSHSILSVPHRLRDGLVAIHRMFDSYLSRMGSFPCYGDLQAQSNDRSSRLQQAMLQHSVF